MKALAFFSIFAFFICLYGEDDLVTVLLGKYTGIKSFSSDYERVFTQNSTAKKSFDNGKILFSAPSDIRMDTFVDKKLTEQTFVNSEKTVFIYHTKKSVLNKKSAGEAGEYLAFLQGLDEVKKKFDIADSTASIDKARKTGIEIKDGAKLLKLTPKDSIGNVKYIFLVAVNNEIDSVVIIDQLKNINQFKFKNLKYNPKIEKKDLIPVIPKGYETSDF
ncbi:MAG TPA: outer membrane lipoprotein carrier protein LolA [bacterium]|nr:outer membrane lipoprotein carrier protein LolA [bacterium]HPS29058.1 outer membrane lipoprotein carrier protein LolA [bacterium]